MSYIVSTQGQLDALSKPLNHNILQSINNAAVQGSGYRAPGAYEQMGRGSMEGTQATYAPSPAEVAAAQRSAALTSRFGTEQGGIEATGRSQATDLGNTYEGSNRKFLTDYRTGQERINANRANNALNLRRSMSSIAGGVRQGLRSGGVNLANLNALDSGAAEMMAKAWARVGNQQSGDARNQAALKMGEIDMEQTGLNRGREDTLFGLNQYRQTEPARVGNQLGTSLQNLSAQAEGEGIGWRADMGIRDRIVNEAIARLNQIDQMRQNELATIRGLTPEEIQQRAMQMDQAGAAATPFAVEGPEVEFGGGVDGVRGPALSQLPIFTRRRELAA